MASRLGFRLAARSMRQPVLLSQYAGRRMMSSGPAKQSSDTPWIAGAVIGTVSALAFIYSPSGEKVKQHHVEHATTPKKAAAKEKEEAADQTEEPESKSEDNKPEGDASGAAVQDSVKQSIKSDGDPNATKAEEEKGSKGGSGGDKSVEESVKKSMNFDGDPASAKAEEAKQAKSHKSDDGSESDSDSDGGFVKIEKMPVPDVKDTLKKEDMDVPAIAKNEEEKQAKTRN